MEASAVVGHVEVTEPVRALQMLERALASDALRVCIMYRGGNGWRCDGGCEHRELILLQAASNLRKAVAPAFEHVSHTPFIN